MLPFYEKNWIFSYSLMFTDKPITHRIQNIKKETKISWQWSYPYEYLALSLFFKFYLTPEVGVLICMYVLENPRYPYIKSYKFNQHSHTVKEKKLFRILMVRFWVMLKVLYKNAIYLNDVRQGGSSRKSSLNQLKLYQHLILIK